MGKPTDGHWIEKAVACHKGSLHKQLGVAKDARIPAALLAAAAHRKGALGERARLAQTLRSFHHKK